MCSGIVLLIDRIPSMNALMRSYLEASGFAVKTMRSTGELNEEQLTTAHVAVMDIDAAGSGLKTALEMLNNSGVPAIVLTSESDYAGRLSALELGAADVMSRPLDIAELVARIRAVQSRTMVSVPGAKRPPVSFGGLRADISKYSVTLDGQPLELSPKETELAYLLLGSPDTVFSREEISRQLGSSSDRTVNIFVSRLKKAVGRYAENIVAVRGVGYKFSTGEKKRDE